MNQSLLTPVDVTELPATLPLTPRQSARPARETRSRTAAPERKSWWSWLSSFTEPVKTHADSEFLLPPDRLEQLLRMERLRSDRSGLPTSLVVFPVDLAAGTAASSSVDFSLFCQMLERRLRVTDYAGFMPPGRVAVLLWNTAEDGARQFVENISATCGHDGLLPCEIYVYPLPPDRRDELGGRASDPAINAWTRSPRSVEDLVVLPLETLLTRPLPFWKRSLDLVGAGCGLLLASPILLATAVAIRWTSPGPIFFLQKREGLGGRIFTMFKFRTMRVDAEKLQAELRKHSEQDGPAFKMTHDPRVTPIGKFLRKSCIDELPQLINVLRGDMSLVGPRPLPVSESRACTDWERSRLDVTPGLTCIWQVYGKSKVTFKEWMRMDIRYLRSRSLLVDLRLVFKTAVAVLTHRASV